MQPVESCCAANFYATVKVLFFIKTALKLSYFCKEMQNFRALGAPPPDPRASGSWGFCPRTPIGLRPQTPKTALSHCEFLATRLRTCTPTTGYFHDEIGIC